jgi:hypothetical protein
MQKRRNPHASDKGTLPNKKGKRFPFQAPQVCVTATAGVCVHVYVCVCESTITKGQEKEKEGDMMKTGRQRITRRKSRVVCSFRMETPLTSGAGRLTVVIHKTQLADDALISHQRTHTHMPQRRYS